MQWKIGSSEKATCQRARDYFWKCFSGERSAGNCFPKFFAHKLKYLACDTREQQVFAEFIPRDSCPQQFSAPREADFGPIQGRNIAGNYSSCFFGIDCAFKKFVGAGSLFFHSDQRSLNLAPS